MLTSDTHESDLWIFGNFCTGLITAIKEAGGSPKYTEYPNVGHDSWTQTYNNREFFQWLFAQKQP